MSENTKTCTTEKNSDSTSPLSIPYSTAILQSQKNRYYSHIFVTWEGAPENTKTVIFETLGAIKVISHPKLPCGYYMEWHDTWIILANQIYDQKRDSSASFQRLDLIVKDCQIFKDEVCGMYYDIPVYDDRKKYAKHCANIYSANLSLLNSMLTSLGLTFRNTVNEQYRQISSIEKALLLMFPTLNEATIKLIENTLQDTLQRNNRGQTIYTDNEKTLNFILLAVEFTFNNTVDNQSQPISTIEKALSIMFPNVSKTSLGSIANTLKKYLKW